jgi:glycosyltransferase involved in cell wall biosynthesis
MPSKAKRAIVSVTNDLATDNRVHRTCTVLQELGYEVLLVGRILPGSLPLERPYTTKRMRLLFSKGPLFYAEYNLRLFLLLFVVRASLFVANDLDTLLPNFLVAWLRGRQLVYDTHEFYTEVPELVARPRVRAVWLAIERWIFKKLAHVLTVNRSIANAYAERYPQREGEAIAVVRNIPMRREAGPQPTRAELGLPEAAKLLVLQGAGINVDRGAEEAVLAMKDLPGHLLLVIGGGDAWPVLERMVTEHGLQDRVRLLGKMPYERMMAHTRHALVGLTLDKDSNLNYRFSLPNKLFDYLQAGVPVVATDLPEVAAIVREHGCGLVIPAPEPAIIAAAVQRLTADPHQHDAMRQRAIFAARSLDGEREKEVLKAFLARLG